MPTSETATATHNGADDATFTLTCTSLTTGRYKVTGTVPAGYAAGDIVQISAKWVISSSTYGSICDEFQVVTARPGIDNIPANLQSLGQPGAIATVYASQGEGAVVNFAPNVGTFNYFLQVDYNGNALVALNDGSYSAATFPANFNSLVIDGNGRVDLSKIVGQGVTCSAGVTVGPDAWATLCTPWSSMPAGTATRVRAQGPANSRLLAA